MNLTGWHVILSIVIESVYGFLAQRPILHDCFLLKTPNSTPAGFWLV
jgi:hypothetical protein